MFKKAIAVMALATVSALSSTALPAGAEEGVRVTEQGAEVAGYSLVTPLTAYGNVEVGTQYGDVKRMAFRQNVDGSGYYFQVYGSGNCTSSTTDVDVQIADMLTYQWDNAASYARDWANCDVKIFRYANFSDALTNYVDYGSTGSSLGANNNLTSSFRVS